MKQTLVIGSGISGLTMALLLAQQGRQVTIVEQLPFIGGYLNRFTRSGLRFDTGLHFTGGFDNILPQLLKRLNLQDLVKPTPIQTDVLLADTQRRFTLPACGLDALADTLIQQFPAQAQPIRTFYQAEQNVIDHTPIFDLDTYPQHTDLFSQLTDYDAVTVDEALAQFGITDPELQAILPIMALCHGTPPCEAPFPYHCRCAYGLDTNLSAITHGGDAFLTAFKRELARHHAVIRTRTTISSLQFSPTQPRCTAATLSDGTTIETDEIYFAVHPQAYLPLFPDTLLTPQIHRRARNLKPTCSFFTLYAWLDDDVAEPVSRLTFYLQNKDLNRILLPGHHATNTSTGMVTSRDPVNPHPTFTAFRTMFLEDAEALCGTTIHDYRQADAYLQLKQSMTETILQDVYQAYPHYRGHLHLIDAASPFTCQRFSPPTGAAYGTRQFLGRSRLAGRLPVENCYALGHHAQFPGILGCMLGAFSLFLQPPTP